MDLDSIAKRMFGNPFRVKSNQYGFRLGTKDNCIILNERYKLNLTNMDLDYVGGRVISKVENMLNLTNMDLDFEILITCLDATNLLVKSNQYGFRLYGYFRK